MTLILGKSVAIVYVKKKGLRGLDYEQLKRKN